MKQPDLARIAALDPEKRLTRKQAAALCHCSAGTIAKHNHAGILPYFPTVPVLVRAGDLRVYASAILTKRRSLHLGMRIRAEDMPPYSRLDGIIALDKGHPSTMAANVVKMTGHLWRKYRRK